MNIVHVGVSLLMLTSANVAAEDTTKTTDTSSVRVNDPQTAVFRGENPVKTTITPKQKNEQKPNQRVKIAHKPHIPQDRVIQMGKSMAHKRGWDGAQWTALYKLWHKESGWDPHATNPSSGAYGIPQSLPGSKMRSAGEDWRTNPRTQIRWGLNYIEQRYGTPAQAWNHSQRHNWY